MVFIYLVQLRRERWAPPDAEEGVDPGRELRLAAQVDARRVAVDALVRRRLVDGLRARIRTLIQDRTAASAMVERGRRYVSEQLGFEVIAQRHLRVYEAVCA